MTEDDWRLVRLLATTGMATYGQFGRLLHPVQSVSKQALYQRLQRLGPPAAVGGRGLGWLQRVPIAGGDVWVLTRAGAAAATHRFGWGAAVGAGREKWRQHGLAVSETYIALTTGVPSLLEGGPVEAIIGERHIRAMHYNPAAGALVPRYSYVDDGRGSFLKTAPYLIASRSTVNAWKVPDLWVDRASADGSRTVGVPVEVEMTRKTAERTARAMHDYAASWTAGLINRVLWVAPDSAFAANLRRLAVEAVGTDAFAHFAVLPQMAAPWAFSPTIRR